jgi:hypothetical protein
MRGYAHGDGCLPHAVPAAGAGRSRSTVLRPVFCLYGHAAGARCTSVEGRPRGGTRGISAGPASSLRAHCDLAVRPLGAMVLTGPGREGRVIVPAGTFNDYAHFISAAIGCYGSSEVIVMLALPRLFPNCVEVLPNFRDHLRHLDQAAAAALADAERSIPRPTDLERIRAAARSLRNMINSRSEVKPTSAT